MKNFKFKFNFNDESTIKAFKFKEQNPAMYKKIVEEASRQHNDGVKQLSIRDICSKIRWQYHIPISNNITPVLARIIETEYPHLNFKKSKIKSVIMEVA